MHAEGLSATPLWSPSPAVTPTPVFSSALPSAPSSPQPHHLRPAAAARAQPGRTAHTHGRSGQGKLQLVGEGRVKGRSSATGTACVGRGRAGNSRGCAAWLAPVGRPFCALPTSSPHAPRCLISFHAPRSLQCHPQVLAFYAKPYWRKAGVPLEEQATVALEPAAFNPDHPLYIDSVFDVRRLDC